MLNSVSFLNKISNQTYQNTSPSASKTVGLKHDVFQKTSDLSFKRNVALLESQATQTTIIDKKSGEKINAVIKFCDNEGKDKFKLISGKLLMGEVSFIDMPRYPYNKGLFQNTQYLEEGCIFVTLIESNFHKKYAGVGTRLMQEVVKKSLEEGHQGRVILESTNGSGPFYYKLGFKPYYDPDGRCTKAIIDKINNPKKYSFLDNAIIEMYLPEENVASLLKK